MKNDTMQQFAPRELWLAVNRKLATESRAGWPQPAADLPLLPNPPAPKSATYPQAKPLAMAVNERPRNRAKKYGTPALSDTELLALILQGAGAAHEASLKAAKSLLAAGSTLGGLAAHPDLLPAMAGAARAKQLEAVFEVARRIALEARGESPVLKRAEAVKDFMFPLMLGLEVEKFWVLCLDRKNRLLKRVEISSGTATAALAHPREVFRAAIRESATAVVCVHNHPSGDPAPSAPDIHVTRQLGDAAKAVAIELVDHVIVGRVGADPLGRGYFSFREAGML